MRNKRVIKNMNLSAIIKKLKLFVKKNIRIKHLENFHHFLKTVRLTSVESKKAFSYTRLICTKIRSK